MDVYHIFLVIPWKFDRNGIHDGRKNTYTLEKNGTHFVANRGEESEKGSQHKHTSHLGIVRQGFGQRELESMRSTNDVESKQGWRIENVYKLKIH
jgi:hypothetical protein